ncbi:amino acid adenylation protein [Anopheles sinensis]|uniref:Amino acid adenylation protein n=1 Tax=Anopheles sinensis TaxID=74873 RepID=A0A084WH44_ANOSI|nr:amino acid adenylation protein [Anopheles sinensis]
MTPPVEGTESFGGGTSTTNDITTGLRGESLFSVCELRNPAVKMLGNEKAF